MHTLQRISVIPQFLSGPIRRAAAPFAVVLSLVLLPIAAGPAHARDRAADASGWVADLGDRTLAILRDTPAASPARHGRFHALIAEKFDVPVIAQFVAGRFWHAATDAERSRFTSAFGDYVTGLYTARFSRYTKQTFAIVGLRAETDGTATVSSEIIEPNATPGERVDWRVASTGAGYKITDVSVSGVSIARTKRDEFGAVMARNGGRISAVTAALEGANANRAQSAQRGD
jgi:phospholipid transport system substrate-binding protein